MKLKYFFLLAAFSLVACAQTSPFVTVRDGHFEKGGKPYCYVGTNFWYGAILGSEGQGGDRERLVKDGYAAVVVVNEAGKTYRVVCASFDTKEEAVTERGKFKAKYPDNQDFQSAWILYRK